MKERRKHKRLTVMGLIHAILPGESRTREVYLSNISRGGIGIYLHREVKTGQKIALVLTFQNERYGEREEKITLRVCWSSRIGRLYMAGLKFSRLTDERYKEILKALSVFQ